MKKVEKLTSGFDTVTAEMQIIVARCTTTTVFRL